MAYIERKVQVGVGGEPAYYLAKEAQICSLASRGVFYGAGQMSEWLECCPESMGTRV